MKSKLLLGVILVTLVLVLSTGTGAAIAGFNQFGYNYQARLFVGLADGVDKTLDGTVWGDPTYANDHLVMKWNAQWDACNAAGTDAAADCLGAWTDNEWNGNVPGGSGVTDHYKIIWVGPEASSSPYWATGGYSVWGSYEVIMDQGTDSTGHFIFALATPNGYGR